MFADFLPESGGVFLFDLMRNKGFVSKRKLPRKSYSIFDPCSSRLEPLLQSAVRGLARDAGAEIETTNDGEWAKCCGWGGHVSIANPDYAKSVVNKRIGHSKFPFITYCVNCRDIFAEAGKESLHLLDVLFDLNDGGRPSPGFSERRENRVKLRRKVTAEFGDQESSTDDKISENRGMNLRIDETLRRKLAIDLVLEEDAEQTVKRCESEGRTVTDSITGHKHGYAVIGRITCWVEYKNLADGDYQLINAYCHRMAIDLEETWRGQRTKTDL
jgi:hypothetical protein